MVGDGGTWIVRNVTIMEIAGFTKGMLHSFLDWFLPILLIQRGVTTFALSYTLSMPLSSASALMGGYFADKSRKWPLVSADAIFVLSLSMLSASVYYQLLDAVALPLSVCLYNVSEAWPTSPSFLTRVESVPKSFQGKFLSLGIPTSAGSGIVGSLLFGYMYLSLGNELFKYLVLIALAIVILRLFIVETVSPLETSRNYFSGLKPLLFERTYRSVLVLSLLLGLATVSAAFLSPFLCEAGKLDVTSIAFLFSILNAVRLVSALFHGYVIDKTREKYAFMKVASAALLAGGFSLALFIILTPWNSIFAWLILVPQALIPFYRPAINIFIAVHYVQYRGMAIAGMHALSDLTALLFPLMTLAWISSPLLCLLIFNSLATLLGGLILYSTSRRLTYE